LLTNILDNTKYDTEFAAAQPSDCQSKAKQASGLEYTLLIIKKPQREAGVSDV
jgi:hypothetical protein